MTSITFPRIVGTLPRNIENILPFLDMRAYGWNDYYLLVVRPEIRIYMTENLFKKNRSEYVVPESRSSTSFTKKDFEIMLEDMKRQAEEFKGVLEVFNERRGELISLRRESEGVKKFENSDDLVSFKRVQKLDMVQAIETLSEGNIDETSMKAYAFLFTTLRMHILVLLEKFIAERVVFWEAAEKLYAEDEDAYVEKYGEINYEEYLEYYRSLSPVYYFGEAIKAIDENDSREIDEIVGNTSVSEDKKRVQLRKILDNFCGKKESTNIDEQFLQVLIDSYADIYETTVDELDEDEEYRELTDLIKFYKSISAIHDILDNEMEKASLLAEYEADGSPQKVNKYQSIYTFLAKKVRAEAMKIPFIGEMSSLFDEIPDYDNVEYIPVAHHEFPNISEMHSLNEVDHTLVRKIVVTSSQIVTDRTNRLGFGKTEHEARVSVQNIKRVDHEIQMVGFVNHPNYLIKVRPMGGVIEGERYNESPDSLPSPNGSILDYINHTKSFRARRRGKVYCIFYHEGKPYAADDLQIYPLDPIGKAMYETSVEKKLSQISIFLADAYQNSNGNYSNEEAIKLISELSDVIDKSEWTKYNSVDARTVREAVDAAKDLSASRKKDEFEAALTKLIEKHVKDQMPTLDFYTQEALLYVWNLSKVNLDWREDSMSGYRECTHTEHTYLVASVKKPDDLFYNKGIGSVYDLPYDVLILSSNIFPRPLLTEMMQISATRKDQRHKDGFSVKVEYTDQIWMRRFMSNPCLEVFDDKTMSVVVYCSRDEFATEILTGLGSSLQVKQVAERLKLLSRETIEHDQYSLGPELSVSRFIAYLKEKVANPLLIHYLLPNETRNTPALNQQEHNLVKQALAGVAYTLYCKLKSGFQDSQLQDLTTVVNSNSPIFHKYQFTRMISETAVSEELLTRIRHKAGDYMIDCQISKIEREQVLLTPRSTDTEIGVERPLSVIDSAGAEKYFNYLANFYDQMGSPTRGFDTSESRNYEKIRDIIERFIEVPAILKAQVIERVIAGERTSFKSLDQKAVGVFIDSIDRALKQPKIATRNLDKYAIPQIATSYGLKVTLTDNTITIEDKILKISKTFTTPFVKEATYTTTRKPIIEKKLDQPFVGSMDMTFLTLLDHALYQGEEKFLNGLFTIYHTYNGQGFYAEELGSFLWSELITKELSDATKQRIYYLISYQSRNLILQSSERVLLKEGQLHDARSTIIRRNNIKLHRTDTA